MSNTSWMANANCLSADKDLFFPAKQVTPDKHIKIAKALALCDACEVKQECLNYSIENEIIYGIWGGLGSYQRRKLMPNVV